MEILELMTRNIISLSPDEIVLDHINIFKTNKIHHIPIVNERNEVLGMISSRDFENFANILKILDSGKQPVRIRDIMSEPIFSYFEDVDIKDAAQAMIDNNFNAIVVMNREEQMTGILTSTDLLKYIADHG